MDVWVDREWRYKAEREGGGARYERWGEAEAQTCLRGRRGKLGICKEEGPEASLQRPYDCLATEGPRSAPRSSELLAGSMSQDLVDSDFPMINLRNSGTDGA